MAGSIKAISLALGLLALTPAWADSGKYAQRLAQVMANAGPPAISVNYRGTYDWETLGEHTILLWETRQRAYYVDVEPTCDEFPWAMTISIDVHNMSLSKFDKIKVRGRSCWISEIRPVDVKGLKAAEKEAKAAKAS